MSRSKIETARYEMKQGLINIDGKGKLNFELLNKINEIICSMANIGPDSAGGNIFIGIADDLTDAETIERTYRIEKTIFSDKYIVGIERELRFRS